MGKLDMVSLEQQIGAGGKAGEQPLVADEEALARDDEDDKLIKKEDNTHQIQKPQNGKIVENERQKKLEEPPQKQSTASKATISATNSLGIIFQTALYLGLCLLFALQLVAILNNHSHLGGLTMFDTLLLLIVHADPTGPPIGWLFGIGGWHLGHSKTSSTEWRPLLLVIGGIVFQALLFVNFTHALEAITCSDSSSHFSTAFIGMVTLNIVAKSPLLFCSHRLSLADLSLANRLLLHFGPSLATLGLFAANWQFSPDDDFWVSYLDRYFGAALCLLLAFGVFPIFWNNLAFLLCDAPEGIDADELKMKIEKEFPQVRCPHLHIYRKWPDHKGFDAFAHVQVELQDFGLEQQQQVNHLMDQVHQLLKQTGARRADIQPILTLNDQQNMPLALPQSIWRFCATGCQMGDKSCCGAEETVAATATQQTPNGKAAKTNAIVLV